MNLSIAISTLFLAGLAGSLHCIGMCGPILLGLSQSFNASKEKTSDADGDSKVVKSNTFDFVWYHIGRIWTYGMLGFIAGLLGRELGTRSSWLGWQQTVGLGFGAIVVLTGLALLGVLPGVNLDRLLHSCAFKRFGPKRWFRSLIQQRTAGSRLLIGASMGLLPCGLVYGALLIAISVQSPLYSAIGMIAFGIGTIPALSAVLIGANLIPSRWRAHGSRMAGVVVMLTGAWMVWRSAMIESGICACGVQ